MCVRGVRMQVCMYLCLTAWRQVRNNVWSLNNLATVIKKTFIADTSMTADILLIPTYNHINNHHIKLFVCHVNLCAIALA